MPIYMDRHYNVDFTPEAVAEAHRRDLEHAHEHGVEFKTYWFDKERKTIFCLAEAPGIDSVRKVHALAHGDEFSEIIEVDESLVEAFLGRVSDPDFAPQDQTPPDSPFRAIMFTDLQESTQMASQFGDERALEMLRSHNDLTRQALQEHDGDEIKHTGDGFMTSFTSVTDAVRCAVQIQRGFAAYNHEAQDAPMHLRIGLSAGEPVMDDKQLFGLAVNLAARICAAAEPDQILVAQVVRDLCLGKQISFEDGGEFTPQGFHQPVRVFEVLWKNA
jgi:class 3 adenylate cyclase